MSAIGSAPFAFIAAGQLADRVFEPLFTDAGGLIDSVFGSGPGRGIGLLPVLSGAFVVVTAFAAWRHPRIRNLEQEVPDFDEAAVASSVAYD